MFDRNIVLLTILISAFKLLAIPGYHSTDFEVHRNWLAVTYSLPISQWYTEATSQWTLDYPPLFAWFEWGLSQIAQFIDPKILIVSNLNYVSMQCIIFQHLSVIASDLLLVSAAWNLSIFLFGPLKYLESRTATLIFFISFNFGQILVDHLHFQYNGFLFGVLFWSILFMLKQNYVKSAFLFAVLMNLKHLFLYSSPAYFLFLLRHYCFKKRNKKGDVIYSSFCFKSFLKLASAVLFVFLLSFGPFIYHNQTIQVLQRLFPFKRGLCHAYWAPNFWAIYNTIDKTLTVLLKLFGLKFNSTKASMTGGLVQEFQHAVLPSICPGTTLLCTTLAMLPTFYHTWKHSRSSNDFLHCLTLCGFASYMFGWHVHEKAILMIILPMSILAVKEKRFAPTFALLSTVGHFSLFPLIFTPLEYPVKVLLLLFCTYVTFSLLRAVHNTALLNQWESLYLLGLIPLEAYCTVIHRLVGLQEALPFLPLIIISGYCSVGILYCWLRYYAMVLSVGVTKREIKKCS